MKSIGKTLARKIKTILANRNPRHRRKVIGPPELGVAHAFERLSDGPDGRGDEWWKRPSHSVERRTGSHLGEGVEPPDYTELTGELQSQCHAEIKIAQEFVRGATGSGTPTEMLIGLKGLNSISDAEQRRALTFCFFRLMSEANSGRLARDLLRGSLDLSPHDEQDVQADAGSAPHFEHLGDTPGGR